MALISYHTGFVIKAVDEFILSPFNRSGLCAYDMERDTGFEPAPSAWKAEMLAADTNPAKGRGNPEITPEKIGTLKKGEKISSFPVLLLYQKIFEKSTHFLMYQRQYSWYASSRSGKSK